MLYRKELEMIKEIETTKLNMQEGEVLVITIKSDGVKLEDIESIREGFKKRFPANDVLVLAVAVEDSIELSVVSAEKAKELGDEK